MWSFLKAEIRWAGLSLLIPAGLSITAAVWLVLGANFGKTAAESHPPAEDRRPFNSVYEPSGLAQLPDGRLVVVEDEKSQPISILTLDDGLTISAAPLQTNSFFAMASGAPSLGTLDDLEALAVDDRGFVYAITSHSRTASGKRNPAREKLARFRLEGKEIAEAAVLGGLRKAMAKVDKKLRKAAKVSDVKDDNGFNIEGLSFNKAKDALLIGLRSPVIRDQGVIMVMENPLAAFERGEAPRFAEEPIYLDLDKGGIRAMAFDPKLDGYLIVSRQEKKGEGFKLWLWDGVPGHGPRRVHVDGEHDLSNAEGITPLRHRGAEKLLIAFDTGDGIKRKGSDYLLLTYDRLRVEPPPD